MYRVKAQPQGAVSPLSLVEPPRRQKHRNSFEVVKDPYTLPTALGERYSQTILSNSQRHSANVSSTYQRDSELAQSLLYINNYSASAPPETETLSICIGLLPSSMVGDQLIFIKTSGILYGHAVVQHIIVYNIWIKSVKALKYRNKR